MFYVKNDLGEKAPITSENTFCMCPNCGKEVHADLEALSMESEGDIELYGKAAIWCEDCSEKAAEEQRIAEAAKQAQEPMFRAIDTETGEIAYLSRSIFEAECPDCGKMHPVELDELVLTMRDLGSGWYDMSVCCDGCSAKRQLRECSEPLAVKCTDAGDRSDLRATPRDAEYFDNMADAMEALIKVWKADGVSPKERYLRLQRAFSEILPEVPPEAFPTEEAHHA